MIAPWALPKAPTNPCLMYIPGNSLTAYERQSPSYGDGRRKALSLTGSGAVRYQAASGARTNWFPNPGLASNATSWTDAGAAVGTRTADGDFRSGWCDEVVATASTADGINLTTGTVNVATSAQTITVGIANKLISGAADWQARVHLTDAAGTLIGSAGAFVDLVPAAGVAYAILSITAPTTVGAHGIQVQIRRKTAAASTARFSTACIEVGATSGSHVDGSTSLVSAWLDPITGILGTAHASPSVSQAALWVEEGTTNAVPDPSFEAATITTNWTAAGVATINKVTTHAYVGSNGGKVSCTASTLDGIDQLATSGAAAANGESWTLSGRIRAFAAGDVGKTVKPVIVERTSLDVSVVADVGTAITLTDAWQSFAFTQVLGGGGTTAKVTVRFLAGAAVAVDFVLDAVQLEKKAYATSYADGSIGTGYAWSGTAHASSSTRTAATVKVDEVNRANSRNGSLAVFLDRKADLGRLQYLTSIGNYGSGQDLLEFYISAGDQIVSGWYVSADGGSSVAGSTVPASGFAMAYTDWKEVVIRNSLNTGARTQGTRGSSLGTFVGAAAEMTFGGNRLGAAGIELNGLIGPLAIYDSPLTAAERARVVALGPDLRFDSILRYG